MKGLNRVELIGHLGDDPELKIIDGDRPVASFSIATNETWNDKNGNKQERTEWHRIVIWGKLAEIVADCLKKGSQAFFEGKLQTRRWEVNGNVHYITEINCHNVIFMDKKEGGSREQKTQSKGRKEKSYDTSFGRF